MGGGTGDKAPETGQEILERMRRELKEGDLVLISLKDDAKFVAGIFPTITINPLEINNGPNKSCVGHFDGIYDEFVSLKYQQNMVDQDRGSYDVFCDAIKSYYKFPSQPLVI